MGYLRGVARDAADGEAAAGRKADQRLDTPDAFSLHQQQATGQREAQADARRADGACEGGSEHRRVP
eukprot:2206007-Rhodomonas_salina.2